MVKKLEMRKTGNTEDTKYPKFRVKRGMS